MPRKEPEFNPEPGVLTVYSEIACPWATLALTGLRRARRRLGLTRVRIDLRAYPQELLGRPNPKRVVDAEIPVIGGLDETLGWQMWQAADSLWPASTLLPQEAVQAAKRPDVGGLAASDELDAALRHALFAESRCITLLPEVLAVAESCASVNTAALTKALYLGSGRPEVISQWRTAKDRAVAGSPHVFLPDGSEWHNPGVEVRWTGGERGAGFPIVLSHDPTVYDEIFTTATRPAAV
ncbi:hypothetical protein [Actinocatenispora rupis]|uniref:Dithiol-disulfide isomerase n=1 Tax=Actinocatenispora rupis TaxID=519421 RepID=A0A8J3J501_9ACTN|nr:hypothetical protein [Actinocatenispora rupis]GID10284.1 dithiol-disulfide isomerase [Actinocatenispora rupis]